MSNTTGVAPDPTNLQRVREACDLPVVVGSGVTVQNAPTYAPLADAFIVGSSLKVDGDWRNPVDPRRAGDAGGIRFR